MVLTVVSAPAADRLCTVRVEFEDGSEAATLELGSSSTAAAVLGPSSPALADPPVSRLVSSHPLALHGLTSTRIFLPRSKRPPPARHKKQKSKALPAAGDHPCVYLGPVAGPIGTNSRVGDARVCGVGADATLVD